MSDIAEAAGVSRRSLFRHFASKADLIWDGLAPVEAARRSALERARSLPAFEAVRAASLAGVEALPDLEATRTRLRVIASHPELVAFGSHVLSDGTRDLVEQLAARGLPPLSARVLADSVTVAVFDAYLIWATETADASPRATLERALALLGRLANL
jgi:AcrR family transcriptional regulator